MPGKGPAPKDPSRRARHGGTGSDIHVLQVAPSGAPDLPPLRVRDEETGEFLTLDWPTPTLLWWRAWMDSPLTTQWTDIDWAFMLETARLHALFWMGDSKLATELRLRVSKMGATPEDRARLRIQFAQADEADDKREGRKPPRRHAGLKLAN